jgi:hypothetical protein
VFVHSSTLCAPARVDAASTEDTKSVETESHEDNGRCASGDDVAAELDAELSVATWGGFDSMSCLPLKTLRNIPGEPFFAFFITSDERYQVIIREVRGKTEWL